MLYDRTDLYERFQGQKPWNDVEGRNQSQTRSKDYVFLVQWIVLTQIVQNFVFVWVWSDRKEHCWRQKAHQEVEVH